MARKKGAPVHIIKEAGQNPASEMSERLGGLGEYKDVFLSQQDAILLARRPTACWWWWTPTGPSRW